MGAVNSVAQNRLRQQVGEALDEEFIETKVQLLREIAKRVVAEEVGDQLERFWKIMAKLKTAWTSGVVGWIVKIVGTFLLVLLVQYLIVWGIHGFSTMYLSLFERPLAAAVLMIAVGVGIYKFQLSRRNKMVVVDEKPIEAISEEVKTKIEGPVSVAQVVVPKSPSTTKPVKRVTLRKVEQTVSEKGGDRKKPVTERIVEPALDPSPPVIVNEASSKDKEKKESVAAVKGEDSPRPSTSSKQNSSHMVDRLSPPTETLGPSGDGRSGTSETSDSASGTTSSRSERRAEKKKRKQMDKEARVAARTAKKDRLPHFVESVEEEDEILQRAKWVGPTSVQSRDMIKRAVGMVVEINNLSPDWLGAPAFFVADKTFGGELVRPQPQWIQPFSRVSFPVQRGNRLAGGTTGVFSYTPFVVSRKSQGEDVSDKVKREYKLVWYWFVPFTQAGMSNDCNAVFVKESIQIGMNVKNGMFSFTPRFENCEKLGDYMVSSCISRGVNRPLFQICLEPYVA